MVIGKSKKTIYDIAEKQQDKIKTLRDSYLEYARKIKDGTLTEDERMEMNFVVMKSLNEIDVWAAAIQNRCHDFW